ncbi:DUF4262 domain-containing protein [Chitinophaga pinensis]|uniref:DUF4262 domain-containing protein n=1 Tax=Chitinophaga pinensis (strain ATCC 43595 / DSM 2588 / LMG 13176 / NBRC 15968 / NCIMB 11800 / UQM 2034) TaxID=485918 RepID=A0A979G998_CHIPD|nr:DUF4262 domain-containing protein [Chitinophaga pinensis]ACU63076.1 hypothetical protein Cpin_5652 [Chitinophaga pinensis DSM 2588]
MTTDHAQHDREAEEKILHDVEKYGCHIAMLEAEDHLPSFAYTIGLYKTFGQPEIICFGLPVKTMAGLLNDAADIIREGGSFVTGKLYATFLVDYYIQFLEVNKASYRDYVGYAGWFNGNFDFPLLQFVWPDKQHHFPWEESFNPDWQFLQPLLDRNMDFKFPEKKNLAVFVMKQAFEGMPVLKIYHGHDGDWEFHTHDDYQIEDVILVALERMTKLDPSINRVFGLPRGYKAWRESREDDWEYAPYEASEDDEEEDI